MSRPGRNGANPLIPLAVLLAAGGVILGFVLVQDPGVVVPLTLLVLLLLGLTHLFLTLETNNRTRRWLWGLVLAALGVRAVAFIVVHYFFDPYFFAPDGWAYQRWGEEISAHWRYGAPLSARFEEGWFHLYPHIAAAFHYLLGDAVVGPVVLNAFSGVWTAVVAFYLGRELLGEHAGKAAALLTGFFPSMVLWSVLHIRDAPAMLAVTLAVWLGVRQYRKLRVPELLLLVGTLFVLSTLRDYMAVLVLAGLLLGYTLALRPDRIWRTLAVGTGLVLFGIFTLEQFDIFQREWEEPLQTVEGIRRGFHLGAESAYGLEYDVSTLGGAVRFFPIGISFLLFAPFPWALETTLQATTFPEVLVWYLLFPLTAWGFVWGVRKGARQNLILFGTVAVLVTAYGLAEGNFGTAYRHRAQIMPLFFIYTAAGMILLRHVWRVGRHPVGRRDPGERGPRPSPRPPVGRGSQSWEGR